MLKSLAASTLQAWQVASLAPGFAASGFRNRLHLRRSILDESVRERLAAPLLGLGILRTCLVPGPEIILAAAHSDSLFRAIQPVGEDAQVIGRTGEQELR